MSVRSRSNWNLDMLVFEDRGKTVYPEKNLSLQRREPTTNSTHIWRRRRDLNPGHTGGGECFHHCVTLAPLSCLLKSFLIFLGQSSKIAYSHRTLYINLTPLSMYQIKGKHIENNHYIRDTKLGFSLFCSFNCIFLHFRRLVWRSVSSLSPP